jgi:hypothetical protein
MELRGLSIRDCLNRPRGCLSLKSICLARNSHWRTAPHLQRIVVQLSTRLVQFEGPGAQSEVGRDLSSCLLAACFEGGPKRGVARFKKGHGKPFLEACIAIFVNRSSCYCLKVRRVPGLLDGWCLVRVSMHQLLPEALIQSSFCTAEDVAFGQSSGFARERRIGMGTWGVVHWKSLRGIGSTNRSRVLLPVTIRQVLSCSGSTAGVASMREVRRQIPARRSC